MTFAVLKSRIAKCTMIPAKTVVKRFARKAILKLITKSALKKSLTVLTIKIMVIATTVNPDIL